MKILFLTLAPFFTNPGHIARLRSILPKLSERNQITVVCLHRESDNEQTINDFPKVKFLHYPIKNNGWYLEDKEKTINGIVSLVKNMSPDICILQMEAWELVRELNIALQGITKFATVVHAMPFLVSPIKPTGNFENDVKLYLESGIEEFRKDYVSDHYKEAYEVYRSLNIITSNKTVSYFLTKYFDNLRLNEYIPIVKQVRKNIAKNDSKLLYDFVFMARIESGKGIEYLEKILNTAAKILKRQVSIIVLGRVDDEASKIALNSLIEHQSSNTYKVEYKGWVDDNEKDKILPNCGVFLYPSHYDNFPTVVNEALSYGLPVITWDVPFSRINYSDLKSVKISSLFDFDKFSNLAVECLSNRNNLIKYSLQYFDNLQTLEDVVANDISIYKSIINRADD